MTNDKEGGIIQKNNRGGAVYGRKQQIEQKFWGGGRVNPSKKIWKKWWFWLIVIVFIGLLIPKDNSDEQKEPETKVETTTPELKTQTETTQPETETTEQETETTQPETVEQEPTEKAEEPAAGKNINDIGAYFSVSDVRNDVTGNWRISTIAENVDIQEYALSYYKEYFKDDKEIHAIVNFNYKTTTKISVIGNTLDVSIYDYVDGEEHDAKLLFSGTLLKEYSVNMDNGSIEEIQ